MKKIFKSMLAVMIVFMQLSSPMLVFADTIEEEIIAEENTDENKEVTQEEVVEEKIIEDEVIVEEENIINEEINDQEEAIIEKIEEKDVIEDIKDNDVVENNSNVKVNNFTKNGSSVEDSFDISATVSDNKIKIDVKKNSDNNYIASVLDFKYIYILTYADISTGSLNILEIPYMKDKLINEILNLNVKELILADNTDVDLINILKNNYGIDINISSEYLEDKY